MFTTRAVQPKATIDQTLSPSVAPDVMRDIFSLFINLPDIGNFNLVCHSWYSLNDSGVVWHSRFKYCFPDLYIKYRNPGYAELLGKPIDWRERFINSYLAACIDMSASNLPLYWVIRRCQPNEIKQALSEYHWQVICYLVDMQGRSIWNFLSSIDDERQKQDVKNILFNSISKDYKDNYGILNFDAKLSDMNRFDIPFIKILTFNYDFPEIIVYATLCDQDVIISEWINTRTPNDITSDIVTFESLSRLAFTMESRLTFDLVFKQYEQLSVQGQFRYPLRFLLSCPEEIFSQSNTKKQSFFNFVFQLIIDRQDAFELSDRSVLQAAIILNQEEYIQDTDNEVFSTAPDLLLNCGNAEMYALVRNKGCEPFNIDSNSDEDSSSDEDSDNHSYNYIPTLLMYAYKLDDLDFFNAVYNDCKNIDISKLLKKLVSINSSADCLRYLLARTTALNDKLLCHALASPANFNQLLLHGCNVINGVKKIPPKSYVGVEFSFTIFKSLEALGIDINHLTNNNVHVLFDSQYSHHRFDLKLIEYLSSMLDLNYVSNKNNKLKVNNEMLIRWVAKSHISQIWHRNDPFALRFAKIIKVLLRTGIDLEARFDKDTWGIKDCLRDQLDSISAEEIKSDLLTTVNSMPIAHKDLGLEVNLPK